MAFAHTATHVVMQPGGGPVAEFPELDDAVAFAEGQLSGEHGEYDHLLIVPVTKIKEIS